MPMHRSRIGLILIDHPEADWAAGLAFWAGVQGAEPTGEAMYRALGTAGGLAVESQRLGDETPARIHLDIESDDIEAEVARVTALGATVLATHDSYTILQDPGGLVFCVVGIQTGDDFERHAKTWD